MCRSYSKWLGDLIELLIFYIFINNERVFSWIESVDVVYWFWSIFLDLNGERYLINKFHYLYVRGGI